MLRTRKNLTLIELVVVLLVLVALAGILIPQFGDMVTRSHGASGADNANEIAKAITFFQTSKLRNPSNFGVPIQANGTAIANAANGDPIFPEGTDFDIDVLDLNANANATASLTKAGITTLSRVNTTLTESATFGVENSASDNLNSLAANAFVPVLTAAGATSLGLPAVNNTDTFYVVLGVGDTCELIGDGMVSAPIHFPEGGDGLPNLAYARWFAVYLVDATSADPAAAKLVSVTANDDGTASGAQKHIEEYFESTE